MRDSHGRILAPYARLHSSIICVPHIKNESDTQSKQSFMQRGATRRMDDSREAFLCLETVSSCSVTFSGFFPGFPPFCGNGIVAGMTLLRVYFTFVPQLSGYPFYEKNLLPEEPLKPDPGRYTNEKAAG
jgi:hypothetical protein